MKIAIGNDHAGTSFKEELVTFLVNNGHEVINCGTDTDSSVDYPDFAKAVSNLVLEKKADFGVLICGTGIGISIAANKINGIMDATVSKKILDASASTIVNFVESFPRFLITCPISSEVDGIVAVNVTFCLSFS